MPRQYHSPDSYPEPESVVTDLAVQEGQGTSVSLTDRAKRTLQISYLEAFGWCLEVRRDLVSTQSLRQPFTGRQLALTRVPLESKHDGHVISLQVGSENLRVATHDAAFDLLLDNECLFRSGAAPFRAHAQPVKLWEGLMSRKVTDFSWRAPQIPSGSQFESYMVRFSYERPQGVVLGLAGQSGELNRNGYRFELYNTDEFVHTPARRPLYQSWPILFHQAFGTTRWVAVFFDNPSRTFVDVGDFYHEHVTFEALDNNQRVYLCVGDSLLEVSRKMTRLLGANALPPAWAFGYQQCRWSYMSTEEIRHVKRAFQSAGVPCDALYFDIDYMNEARVFSTDDTHFGDLRECLTELHSEGLRAVCIVDPGVKIEEGNTLYEALKSSGGVLTDTEGEPFKARVWPGEVVLPDFAEPSTANLWARTQSEWLHQFPFDGVWNDMNEPSNFNGQNSTTSTAHTVRGPFRRESNLYGYWMAKASMEGFAKAYPGRRPFIISRSGYPGVQRYSVNWQGDNQAWWEHMRLAIDQALAYSLGGSFYTGADVPGFTGNPPDDLAVRFFQLGAWLPFFRGHSIFFAKDKEPHAFSGIARELIYACIMQRYTLAREWYSGFARACLEETTPLLPVFTEEGRVVRDQLLWFGKFLVAPVLERDAETRSVYLPEGLWYRLGDPGGEAVRGPRWQMVPVTLADVPVFVRAGSVVTRNDPRATMEATLRAPERVEIYRDASGNAEGFWYDDDYVSVAPQKVTQQRLIARAGSVLTREEMGSEKE